METADITIYATDETAQQFVLFQKHYEPFSVMLNAGVFEQKNATISLHFDHMGTLQIVQRADVLYSRKHLQKPQSMV